jgi:pantetheine-phosphate adenylyltransferase
MYLSEWSGNEKARKMKAVYAGSFDPITLGHVDIIARASQAFELTVVVANNSSKKHMLEIERRKNLIYRALFPAHINANVISMDDGLLVHVCQDIGAKHIIRGFRNTADFEYEQSMARANKILGGVETVFFIAQPDHVHVSSSVVRELIRNKVDPKDFVPSSVNEILKEIFGIGEYA